MKAAYFAAGCFATAIGSFSGIGGGIILKPLLDVWGHYSLSTINILSSFTVLAMAAISLCKYMRCKVKLKGIVSFVVSVGAVAGGLIGKYGFELFVKVLNNEGYAKSLQAVILSGLLAAVVIYMKNQDRFKKYDVKSWSLVFFVGCILGFISAFLGIGGGPVNVAALCLLFSMDTKSAAVHSVIIIFFSQLSKIISIAFSSGFECYNLEMVYLMIISGITGGFLGSWLNRKVDNDEISKIFNIVVMAVLLINLYTAVVNGCTIGTNAP